jgi:hypothetical protein
MITKWKAESIPHGDADLFVAIVTNQDGKQLIAQCTTLDFAKEIEDTHNRFSVELAELEQLRAAAQARATLSRLHWWQRLF